MSLREAWNDMKRADRAVYGLAVLLVVFSFAPYLRAVTDFLDYGWPATKEWSDLASTFERNGQQIILGVAVAFVIGWEVAKAGYAALHEAGAVLVGLFVAIPVATPLAGLSVWLAKLLAPRLPDHPLFSQLVPVHWGVGATVYLLVTALVIAGLKERRERETEA